MGFIEQADELAKLYPGIKWTLFNDMDEWDCPTLRMEFPNGVVYRTMFIKCWGDVPTKLVKQTADRWVQRFLENTL